VVSTGKRHLTIHSEEWDQGDQAAGRLNGPFMSWLEGCVGSATFSEIEGPDCHHPRARSGKLYNCFALK